MLFADYSDKDAFSHEREGKGNMLNFKWLALVLTLTLGANTQAAVGSGSDESEMETVATELQTTVPAVEPTEQGQITGLIDIRPSFTTEGSEFHMENVFELGYRLNPKLKIAFQQQINTNITDSKKPNQGLNPQPMQGFLRTQVNNLYTSGIWSVSYENRIYIPENSNDFDTKHILSMRNYGILSAKVTPNYTISFMEIPILHWYGARGTSKGANQYFENRFYIMNDFTFGKLTVSLPILLNSPYKLEYGGKPGGFSHTLWTWPEVAYQITEQSQLGVALYSESLVTPDFSSTSFTDRGLGFSHSVAQVLFRSIL